MTKEVKQDWSYGRGQFRQYLMITILVKICLIRSGKILKNLESKQINQHSMSHHKWKKNRLSSAYRNPEYSAAEKVKMEQLNWPFAFCHKGQEK